MGKYAIDGVLDLAVSDKDGNSFYIDTAMKMSMSRKNNDNILVIEDALVNDEVANDIINGKYMNKDFRIHGKGYAKGLDYRSYEVTIDIDIARLIEYEIPLCSSEVSKLVFEFPPKYHLYTGTKGFTILDNFNIKFKESEV